ncbi:MAG: ribbon-helix-helix domain-containing protein [Micrococcales bacterium]|nr:ribbon-helix-helix domain-containing protein [Micrococcales bacterium]MCL2666806.1 ribbon-helix-helix domain-containing protein [Micrococcales bacterium]
MTQDNWPPLTDATTDDELDALATEGLLRPIGEPEGGGTLRDEDELRAVFAGRPALGHTHATGRGPSARRQVRLPESTNAALDAYAAHTNTTPSAVIRDALTEYLATHKAG